MKRFFSAAGVVLLGLGAWGTGVEPRLLLDARRVEAPVPNLPPAWEGRTVALLSDFQVGMWGGNVAMAERAVREAVGAGAAALLFAGDFVYQPDSAEVDRAVGVLRPALAAGVPVVAVLGNHDHSLMHRDSEISPEMAGYLRERLEAVGVRVLRNEATALDGGLHVVGIGSVWAEYSDPDAALQAVPDSVPRIALMHNPTSFREIAAGAAPLALAGHTHGGQIRVLPGRSESWLDIVEPGEVVADGWAADSIGAPGNRLYVTRGIGFSGVPVRINCRPELTLLTLRAAPATSSSARRGASG